LDDELDLPLLLLPPLSSAELELLLDELDVDEELEPVDELLPPLSSAELELLLDELDVEDELEVDDEVEDELEFVFELVDELEVDVVDEDELGLPLLFSPLVPLAWLVAVCEPDCDVVPVGPVMLPVHATAASAGAVTSIIRNLRRSLRIVRSLLIILLQ